MHGHGKCKGVILVVAGILLGLISMGVWSSWLNLTSFFAIILIVAGLHGFGCKQCHDHCCEPKDKKKFFGKK